MRDLVKKVSNPITRSYGILSLNTKLAFWYQLAEMMVLRLFLSIIFDLERTNQLSLLPDKDLVDLCPPIEPY
ncbi:MAG: hypothetical protein GPJ03_18320 [Microcystis aeruginosa G13-01]|nr:hypothetical protein [Microcystis aeruginosa G13-01]